jgi:predicted metal-dependent peptidase
MTTWFKLKILPIINNTSNPFISKVLKGCKITVTHKIPTMGYYTSSTLGNNTLLINPHFISKLDRYTIDRLLIHEALYIVQLQANVNYV